MSKNETFPARLIAETLDLPLHAWPGFRNFLVPISSPENPVR